MLHHADVCVSEAQRHSSHSWTLPVTCAHHLSNSSSSFISVEDSSSSGDLFSPPLQVHRLWEILTVWIYIYIYSHMVSTLCWVRTTIIHLFSLFWTFRIWICQFFSFFSVFTSVGRSHSNLGEWKWRQWDGMCGKLWKGFPLRGEGWHDWTKHTVSLKTRAPTTHYTPPQSVPVS